MLKLQSLVCLSEECFPAIEISFDRIESEHHLHIHNSASRGVSASYSQEPSRYWHHLPRFPFVWLSHSIRFWHDPIEQQDLAVLTQGWDQSFEDPSSILVRVVMENKA